MNFIKKTNIGLILLIVAIVGITVYCIVVNNNREKSKEDIKTACNEFINTTNQYAKLPADKQNIGVEKSNIDLDEYYGKMLSDLKKQTINDGTAEIQQSILKNVIETQLYDTSSIVTEFDRQIIKIKSYQYTDTEVTVEFNSRINIKKKYNDINFETGEMTEKLKEQSFDIQGETITLKKVDGKWKVVYANLAFTDVQNSNNTTVNLLNM